MRPTSDVMYSFRLCHLIVIIKIIVYRSEYNVRNTNNLDYTDLQYNIKYE